MKPFGRWAALALAGVLLAGCAPKEASTPQLPAGPNVQTDWSVLANEAPLPAVGERLYEQYTPELIPRDRKIPWTEERGRLQSIGSLRVRHD